MPVQSEVVEKLKLRIEELGKMIFGRRKKKKDKNNSHSAAEDSHNQSRSNTKRSPISFRRPIPEEEEITETKDYRVIRNIWFYPYNLAILNK